MDKRIVLSIGAIIVIGILVVIINLFTPLPKETQTSTQIQEQIKDQPAKSSLEQQGQSFDEEMIEPEQDSQDEDIILLN